MRSAIGDDDIRYDKLQNEYVELTQKYREVAK